MQERVWFLEQMLPGQTAFNVASSFRLKGRIDRASLERALNEIVRRHAPLRTTFEWREGGLVQHVRPAATVSLLDIDLGDVPADGREEALSLLRERIREPFDLTRDLLVRVALVSFAPEEHVLSLVAHHTVWDGWSFDIYRRELDLLYRAFC